MSNAITQFSHAALDCNSSYFGPCLAFEGDKVCRWTNCFQSMADASRARIEAQRAVMQLDGLLKRGRA